MSGPSALFCRRYRAALLDYLLGSGEPGLARAYDLGRGAVEDGLGLLEILRAHQRATTAVLESPHSVNESVRRLKAAEDFLIETLSPYEMTYRGYVNLLQRHREPGNKPPRRPGGRSER